MAECDVSSKKNFCLTCANELKVSGTGKCVSCNRAMSVVLVQWDMQDMLRNFILAADKSACFSCIIANCISCTGGSDKCDGCEAG